jgi:hypothetical protein
VVALRHQQATASVTPAWIPVLVTMALRNGAQPSYLLTKSIRKERINFQAQVDPIDPGDVNFIFFFYRFSK